MSHRTCAAGTLALATSLLLLPGCDLFTDPTDPGLLQVSFDLGEAAEAAPAVDRARVTVHRHGKTDPTYDSIFPVQAGAPVTGIEVPLDRGREEMTLTLGLYGDGSELFRGQAPVEVVSGTPTTVEVEVLPRAGGVAVPASLPVFDALGDTLALEGSVLFTTGDTVPGVAPEWSSSDPSVARVLEGARVVSTGEGSAELTATWDVYSDVLAARVEAEVVQVVLDPDSVLVQLGEELGVDARPLDRNGNTLVREVRWEVDDPRVAKVDEEGRVRGRRLGETSLRAEAVEVVGSAPLVVMPGPPSPGAVEVLEAGSRTLVLRAEVNPNGGATRTRFEVSGSESFSSVVTGRERSVGSGTSPVAVTDTLRGLDPESEYRVRLWAESASGGVAGPPSAAATAEATGAFIDGVVRVEGEPLVGIQAELDGSVRTPTDAEGRFHFDDVESGDHEIRLRQLPQDVQFERLRRTVTAGGVGEVTEVEFSGAWVRNAVIEGRVIASDLPVRSATVVAEGPESAEASTDEQGRFRLDALRPGTWIVRLAEYPPEMEFPQTADTVSLALEEEATVDFTGTDPDVQAVDVFAFIGRPGGPTGVSPVGGVVFDLYATAEDAQSRTGRLSSGSTTTGGRARIAFRRSEDRGSGGGSPDGVVHARVRSLPAGEYDVAGDAQVQITVPAGAAVAAADDTTDIVSGHARLHFTLQTIKTPAPGSGLLLHSWRSHAYSSIGGPPISSTASVHGNVTLNVAVPVSSLPTTVWVRADLNQPLASGNDWHQTPQPAGGAESSGSYLGYELTGVQPLDRTISLGTQRVEYEEMSIFAPSHHEADDLTGVQRSAGDDVVGASAITVRLYRLGGGSRTLEKTQRTHSGGGVVWHGLPAQVAYEVEAISTSSNVSLVNRAGAPVSSVTWGVGSAGGGSVGAFGPGIGGFRHSARVCPLSADTAIANCSAFAYKYNDTSVRGTVRQGSQSGPGVSGADVTLIRCPRVNSCSGGTTVASTSTGGSGQFAFNGQLEGSYEVRVTKGSSSVVGRFRTSGPGDVDDQTIVLP